MPARSKKPGKPSASKRKKPGKKKQAPFPTREQILTFVNEAGKKVGKREIARAFHIRGDDRKKLKEMLRGLDEAGLLTGSRRERRKTGTLPNVAVIAIHDRDNDGEFVARPEKWDEPTEGTPPRILVVQSNTQKGGKSGSARAVGIGDRVLARLSRLDDDPDYAYEARPIRVIGKRTERLLGIFNRHGDSATIDPVDKKKLKSWAVANTDTADAAHGDLVEFEIARKGRYGIGQAQVVKVLGNPADQRQVSLVAIHANDIPNAFPQTVIDALDELPDLTSENREDLRTLPLITIDPADARDHDDAVHAAPDTADDNRHGVVVTVAIADVAHYVKPGSTLDREAEKRGNSCYFPDRVVPMLPEKISNDLCSLRANEDRPSLVVQMRFDKQGHKIDHRFSRALIRSHAKLSYQQAQAAIDGNPDGKTADLLGPVLRPLWDAFAIMMKGRARREPLDLDLPERKIVMNDQGQVEAVVVPERLEAHRLIEEMMIQANVAAAETLENKRTPLIYRVHDSPSKEKLKSLKDFLDTLDIPVATSGTLRPEQFNRILTRVEGSAHEELVSEVVLRSQSQAEYTPQNYGHFGLNLRRYAHFTSPIRRYADLIVHRALISALKAGDDGLRKSDPDRLEDVAEHISMTERRAMTAERETVDRLIASFLAGQLRARFAAKISGVTGSGLFVKLDETGADGFIPISTLGSDYYVHDEDQRALISERSNEMFQLGMPAQVRLVEAVPTAGALRFEMLSDGIKASGKRRDHRRAGPKPRRGRTPGRRRSARR